MADDLLTVLTRFHREILLPDVERIVEERLAPLRDEMLANFDAVFKRLDRLESEYHALRHDGESFVIVRRGEEVARLTPVGEGRKGASLRDLLRLIEEAGPRDPSFADDLEAIQAAQPVQHEASWDS